MGRITPPKPQSRPENAGIWQRMQLFRKDIFRSQPERLYSAWMAKMNTPFRKSFLINDPEILQKVLTDAPEKFPKARIIGAALRALLGRSVFVTNGDEWRAQRRIIDPAFQSARVKQSFPAMRDAGQAALSRFTPGRNELEFQTAHIAADVIFRTLFSIPITHERAASVFDAFRAYQRSQPLLSWRAILGVPEWVPFAAKSGDAGPIRELLAQLVDHRQGEIDAGCAPDDLATNLMTTPDPETGKCFDRGQMIDQVAIFFLAGHETSASALAWALYCISLDGEVQAQMVAEIREQVGDREFEFTDIAKLRFIRDVFREVLRLYPPVPMMVREAASSVEFRGENVPKNALLILSPWHLHRHEKIWDNPDVFDPWRWDRVENKSASRAAYMPFSTGARVCPGASFASVEAVLMLAMIIRDWQISPALPEPTPVAHLTVRAEDGIYVTLKSRR